MMGTKSITVTTGLLFVLYALSLTAQTHELQSLRLEVDGLKAGQQAIQKELAEIKKLLRAQRPQPRRAVAFEPQDVAIKGAPFLGPTDARVTLVEFTDYQCPFCRRHFTNVMPEIRKKYVDTGKLKYVMRQFPLPMHSRATKASEAALCAGDQGKYWEVHKRIFSDQRKLSDEDLIAHAEAEGLATVTFKACLDDGKYTEQVKSDTSDGSKAGVRGTPSFLLGLTDPADPHKIKATAFIRGAQAFDAFKTKIDELLTDPSD